MSSPLDQQRKGDNPMNIIAILTTRIALIASLTIPLCMNEN